MRIIGGKDYYDTAMGYGVDTSLVFDRTGFIVDEEDCPFFTDFGLELKHKGRWYDRLRNDSINFKIVTVFFAGKLYSGIQVYENYLTETKFFWDEEKFLTYLEEHDFEIGHKSWIWNAHNTTEFEFMKRDARKDELDWAVTNKVAIATHIEENRRGKGYWNCNTYNLKNVGFAKVLDPYTAFQELSMFVGGVLPRDPNPMVELTEKETVAKHGFNEWSFRRHKDDPK